MNEQLLAWLLLPSFALGAPAPFLRTGPGVGYESPQAAFEAVQQAVAKKDYKAALACLPVELRRKVAAEIAIQGIYKVRIASRWGDRLYPIQKVLEKHGIGPMQAEHLGLARSTSGASRKKARKALANFIRKPEAFVLEMAAAEPREVTELFGPLGGCFPGPSDRLVFLKMDGIAGAWFVAPPPRDRLFSVPTLMRDARFRKGPAGWTMLPLIDD